VALNQQRLELFTPAWEETARPPKIRRLGGIGGSHPTARASDDAGALVQILNFAPPQPDVAGVSVLHFSLEVHMLLEGKTIADWLRLIQADYLEMPDLILTKPQMSRLWGLDDETRDALVEVLVEAKFLRPTRRGAYVRADRWEGSA
jgi:hypothetical protein